MKRGGRNEQKKDSAGSRVQRGRERRRSSKGFQRAERGEERELHTHTHHSPCLPVESQAAFLAFLALGHIG
jgi:hypothetical protein